MFTMPNNPFKYILTYKYSQDHVELLFSCVQSRRGWNNNPNSLQLKYAQVWWWKMPSQFLKMLTVFRFWNQHHHTNFSHKENKAPLSEGMDENAQDQDEEAKENLMFEHLDQNIPSDFISNILFYIGEKINQEADLWKNERNVLLAAFSNLITTTVERPHMTKCPQLLHLFCSWTTVDWKYHPSPCLRRSNDAKTFLNSQSSRKASAL